MAVSQTAELWPHPHDAVCIRERVREAVSSFQTASEARQWEALDLAMQEAVGKSSKLQWAQNAGGARNVQVCREELQL